METNGCDAEQNSKPTAPGSEEMPVKTMMFDGGPAPLMFSACIRIW